MTNLFESRTYTDVDFEMQWEDVVEQIEDDCCVTCGALAELHGFCEMCVEEYNNAVLEYNEVDDVLAQYIIEDAQLASTIINEDDLPF